MKNSFGLSRTIPNEVKRKVRALSKYGCVVCRCGIYQYEHIEPEFKDAQSHNPAQICCLCGRCHDKINRGQLSKAAVARSYAQIQSDTEVKPPREFFDFHTGKAKLSFGSLTCDISPTTVFQCYDTTVFALTPGGGDSLGEITALFCDDSGKPIFQIVGNEWLGPTFNFDLEIVGNRFILRSPREQLALRLRHDAPGSVVIEHMDMRFKDVHFLASEHDFAIGRYTGYGRNLVWMHVKARIDDVYIPGAAIKIVSPIYQNEHTSPISAKKPGILINQHGCLERVFCTDKALLGHVNPLMCGIHWPALGIQIAEGCGFAISAISCGVCSIEHARRHFFRRNRVNVPTMFLPANLNSETIQRESARANGRNVDTVLPPEPFLVKKDAKGIKEWRQRQTHKNDIASLFTDDEPGLVLALGAIKLVDKYVGPAIRVRRQ